MGRAGWRARESVALRSHAFRSVMAASDSDTLRLSSFCMRSGGNVHFVLVAHGDRGKEQGRHREERAQGGQGGGKRRPGWGWGAERRRGAPTALNAPRRRRASSLSPSPPSAPDPFRSFSPGAPFSLGALLRRDVNKPRATRYPAGSREHLTRTANLPERFPSVARR